MRKNSNLKDSEKGRQGVKGKKREAITIGLDLGDKMSHYCVLAGDGEKLYEGKVATNKQAMAEVMAREKCRIALEVGTHSPWVSRLLASLGHEVIVANARQVKLIRQSSRKSDKLDAQTLARLARVDPQLRSGHPHCRHARIHKINGTSCCC